MENEGVRFRYKFPDDYNPVYANGAYGGIGSRGELVVNFFFERQPIPKDEVHRVDPAGNLGERISRDPSDIERTIIRFVHSGVILNLDSARKIHEWLGTSIQALEKLGNRKPEDNTPSG